VSWIPVFPPSPPVGGITCAASPTRTNAPGAVVACDLRSDGEPEHLAIRAGNLREQRHVDVGQTGRRADHVRDPLIVIVVDRLLG